jgi:hypothetical protein
MMAYQDGFVVSVIHDGHPIRESRGQDGMRTCVLPFDSEYKLRLKNPSFQRAQARVYIDDTPVLSEGRSFLIGANSHVDIERFVDSLFEGRRFKFVPVSHQDVQDPTNKANGIIRVEFQPMTVKFDPEPLIFRSKGLNTRDLGITYASNSVNCCCTATASAGATVEGSYSAQQFTQSKEKLEPAGMPVTIQIQLRGPQPSRATKRWIVDGDRVCYEGKELLDVDQIMVTSSGNYVLFLDRSVVM